MKVKHILFILLFAIGVTSCSDEKKGGPAKRTVLVYVVASNLGGSIQGNINDMITVANKKNLNGGNLIVFYSKNSKEAELYQIKEGKGGVVTKHFIRDYVDQSAISKEVMRSVIDEVFTEFPAESYGLIFSSHGTSWMPTDYKDLRSFGEEENNRMEIYDLADALRGLSLDFITFDACSMAGIECLYELKDITTHIVASPSEILTNGYPYSAILPYFFTDVPQLDKVAEGFYNYYKNHSNPYANISVVKTSELNALAGITREIIASAGIDAMHNLPLSGIQILSRFSAARTSLYDFEDLMSRLATDEQLVRLKACLDKAVTSKYFTERVVIQGGSLYPVSKFSGLSIYPLQINLPQHNEWYMTNLAWAKAIYQ